MGGTNINTAVVGDVLTINNEYTYTHPTYNGDDFSIDTGPLTGATVISDLDINVTTDTLGHVVDANGVVATRNLTLGDLGFLGWDVEVNGTHVLDVGNNTDVDLRTVLIQLHNGQLQVIESNGIIIHLLQAEHS